MFSVRTISAALVPVFAAALVCSVPVGAASHPSASHGSHTARASHPTQSHRSHTTRAAKPPKAPKAPKTHKVKVPRISTPRVYHASSSHRRSDRCLSCDRDEHGRIVRSDKAKEAFEKATGYPKGRRGYVIDHIVPLACGGADLPSNMQWQTAAAAKAKDKTERKGCHR